MSHFPLHIGFDAKRLFYNRTGLGNYSRDLIRTLLHFFPENTYSLFSNSKRASVFNPEFDKYRLHSFSNTLFWRQWGIYKDIASSGIQIYHGLSAELPLSINKTSVKKVVTIHDVIFRKFPKWYPALDRKIYDFKTKFACKHADTIIAISETTKNDLIEFYQINPDKIQVVYQNCSSNFHADINPTLHKNVSSKWHLPQNYILTVGRLEKRKNIMRVAEALTELDSEIHWVCVGKDNGEKKSIVEFLQKNNLINRVHFLENVPSDELVSIYQHCIAFVYISLYEGFGIPVLEGMRAGVPVIASNSSCLQEVAGKNGVYIHPNDVDSLVKNINLLFTNVPFRQQLIENQFKEAKNFSDKFFAKNTMNVYRKLL